MEKEVNTMQHSKVIQCPPCRCLFGWVSSFPSSSGMLKKREREKSLSSSLCRHCSKSFSKWHTAYINHWMWALHQCFILKFKSLRPKERKSMAWEQGHFRNQIQLDMNRDAGAAKHVCFIDSVCFISWTLRKRLMGGTQEEISFLAWLILKFDFDFLLSLLSAIGWLESELSVSEHTFARMMTDTRSKFEEVKI